MILIKPIRLEYVPPAGMFVGRVNIIADVKPIFKKSSIFSNLVVFFYNNSDEVYLQRDGND